MDEEIRRLQLEELEILKYVKKICENNNIRYFMQGGTFLGSIRHKGFIPWDDDADIGIPRPDYNRFVKIVKNDINSNFEISTYEDEQSDYNFICKIHSKNLMVKEIGYKNTREYGIWVDIFPLDGLPRNKLIFKLHKFRLLYRRATWKISEGGKNINLYGSRKSFFDKIIIFFGVNLKFGYLFNKKNEIFKINKLLTKYDYDSSNYVVNFMGAYKFKEMFNKQIYDDYKMYKFEDIELPGPTNYDYYLNQLYGNYMMPPIKDKRNVHSLKIIEDEGES